MAKKIDVEVEDVVEEVKEEVKEKVEDVKNAVKDTCCCEEEGEEKKEKISILGLSRKMLMAAIGAAVIAEEEMTTFVDKLVDRGEIAEKDARKMLKDVIEKREKIAKEKIEEIRTKKPVTVATKEDIEALNEKIAELTKKVEDLKSA